MATATQCATYLGQSRSPLSDGGDSPLRAHAGMRAYRADGYAEVSTDG